MALRVPDSKKAAEVVETVLRRVEMQMGITPTTLQTNEELPSQTNDGTGSVAGLTIDGDFSLMPPPQGASETHTDFQAYDVFLNPQGSQADAAAQMRNNSTSWMGESTGFYWSQFDALTRSGEDAVQPTFQMQNQDWLDRDPLDDLDFITSTMSWQPSTSQG
ncbi:uncharacterized protein BCR38DRAFT_5190 [Pseudomassariella vexata]|uniref:Uncharacterized protein n=1 Tax=Pseudomassariella vexata TaxID=1141098 RepID=A0A1Y2EHZ4_9PEZI|nr:uncharacterized protein BCR38DRAFT_5190 [Pseudomassariella vexata]ORY71199.1 hypothetical protein BCR38DRAFT_5190 [Pseudomassariella vexata]